MAPMATWISNFTSQWWLMNLVQSVRPYPICLNADVGRASHLYCAFPTHGIHARDCFPEWRWFNETLDAGFRGKPGPLEFAVPLFRYAQ